MFTDQVVLRLVAGKGGNGAVSWRRERTIAKGGPTGGNGGVGGSVTLQVDSSVYSLEALRNRRLLKSEKGQAGGPNRRQGRGGKTLVVKVPAGTLVKDPETGDILYDLTEPGQKIEICTGGRGGRGNSSFKTSTRQAPNFATPGTVGEEKRIELELKLIADVGLVGFPNAGKSTLIHAIANTPVKIAPYPFTTLRPNLGYIKLPNHERLLIADIPGIIAGAHQDRGLGFKFLRHIERTKILIYLLDASGIDGRCAVDDYAVLREELGAYDPKLLIRPSLIVLNKCDTLEATEHIEEFHKAYPGLALEISALNNEGLGELLSRCAEQKIDDTCDECDGGTGGPIPPVAQGNASN